MKVDILAFGVHPDDIELSCSGTILKHIELGKKVGIIDLTQGELGTRGNAKIRMKESALASKILGVSFRENLGMSDGNIENSEAQRLKIIRKIRQYQPEIVLCNAISDRHPDHGKAAELVSSSCFYSGLIKIQTSSRSKKQNPWRPQAIYHYIQDRYLKPHFLIDVTEFAEKKKKSILAYSSQFYNPKSIEPSTPISSKEFLEFIESRMREFGRDIGVKFAEGFTSSKNIGVDNFFDLS